MAVRRSSIVLGVIGIVLIILAPIVLFVAVPILTKLPDNTDVRINYAGTANLLNAAALKSGDTKNVIEKNVPITLNRRVHVTSSSGDTAILQDDVTLNAGGSAIPNNHTYAVDRTSLKSVTPPSGTTVQPTTGCLTSAFPLDPKANDSYRLYDATTQRCFPLKYTGKATRGGRDVNVYTVTESGPLRDPNLIKTVPPALPKTTLASLAPVLPASLKAEVGPALPSLPSTVPLSYQGLTKIKVWVDTQTGVAIDQTLNQQVIVGLTIDGKTVSLLPVLAVNAEITPASIKSLADKAASAGRLLTILKIVAPIVLLVLGIGLVVIAVLRRHKPSKKTAASKPSPVGAPG